MKKYLPIVIILIISGCSNSSKENTSQSNSEIKESNSADSTQIVKLVHDFFRAFDDRDLKEMEKILTKGSSSFVVSGRLGGLFHSHLPREIF